MVSLRVRVRIRIRIRIRITMRVGGVFASEGNF